MWKEQWYSLMNQVSLELRGGSRNWVWGQLKGIIVSMELVFDYDHHPRDVSLKDITIFLFRITFQTFNWIFKLQIFTTGIVSFIALYVVFICYVLSCSSIYTDICPLDTESPLYYGRRHRDKWDKIPALKEFIMFQNASHIHLFSISTDPI